MAVFLPFKTQILTLFGASENSIGYSNRPIGILSHQFCIFLSYKDFPSDTQAFHTKDRDFLIALKLGISSFITQMTIVVISLACNIMLVKYGMSSHYGIDIPIAIIGIESKVFTVVINIVVGIILGCQPIISYNYGAKNYKRVRSTYRYALQATIAIGLIATLLFELALPRLSACLDSLQIFQTR